MARTERVEPGRILKEEESASTEENIRFSAQLMNRERLGAQALIVTDWWHELRAAYWARQNGILAAAEPCATWAPLLPVFFARELCGVAGCCWRDIENAPKNDGSARSGVDLFAHVAIK